MWVAQRHICKRIRQKLPLDARGKEWRQFLGWLESTVAEIEGRSSDELEWLTRIRFVDADFFPPINSWGIDTNFTQQTNKQTDDSVFGQLVAAAKLPKITDDALKAK